jgi:hypothetical protein
MTRFGYARVGQDDASQIDALTTAEVYRVHWSSNTARRASR